MPNTDMETCRRCGKTGYKIDEFLEYWTGLCKGCYDAAHAPHKNRAALNFKITGLIRNPDLGNHIQHLKGAIAVIQREAAGCKNQPEQIRRFTRQHLEDLDATYRVLGGAALLNYLEGHIEETLYAIRSQVRHDEADGGQGPGPKNP